MRLYLIFKLKKNIIIIQDMDKLFSIIQQTLTETNKDNKTNLLKDQQISQETINELLEQASNTTLCGPTCQKIRVSQELKQTYLDAETNMQTAPIDLEQSRKNYYVFTEGQTEYENMNEKELVTKATTISELIEQNFNNEVTNANTMNILLNTALNNSEHTIKLFEDYLEKNKTLKLKIKEKHGDILTNDRKTYYETEAIDNLKSWYIFFLIMYFILIIILCLSLVFASHNLTIMKCIIISVLTIFYPLYINHFVKWIYSIWVSFVNRLPKNVYNDL
jgi:hypothetical protein